MMKKYLRGLPVMVLCAVFFLVHPVLADVAAADVEPDITEAPVRIGVSRANFDNVGQILRHFGAGVEFTTLTGADKRDITRLQEFYAIFINCGSQDCFDPRVLNTFVQQGGVVYASDHAGRLIQSAFPGVMQFYTNAPGQVVSGDVVHSTLASHMRMDNLDIIFDLSGWYLITEISEDVTVYIEGEMDYRVTRPLAVSFAYGEGRVFFTSFHNSAQATFHMINFIEYLVFRIKNVEIDRTMQEAAERDGFVYRGAVFGGAGRVAAGMAPAPTPPPMPMPGSVPQAEADGPAFAPAPPAAAAVPDASEPPALWEEYFRYTFTGQGFMLMFGAGDTFETVTLVDPSGRRFVVSRDGTVSPVLLPAAVAVPTLSVAYSDGYRVRVMNITPGEWRFAVEADSDDFMIGIAIMES